MREESIEYDASEDLVRRARLRSQLVDISRKGKGPKPARIVSRLGGIQAQYLNAGILAFRARSTGLTSENVRRALYEERSIVRTWCMRGTIHLMCANDVTWMVRLVAPTIINRQRYRFNQLGLDDDTSKKAADIITRALASHGPLTRKELFARIERAGIDTSGQRGIHLLERASGSGSICTGSCQGNENTYVLLRDWASDFKPRRLEGDKALAQLARIHLKAYAPAEPADLASWSGLSAGDAKRAWQLIGRELKEIRFAGRSLWLLSGDSGILDEVSRPTSSVRLLGGFDTYLLGYRDRSISVEPRHAKLVNAGGGLIKPVVIIDGLAAATWKSTQRSKKLLVELTPFPGRSHLLAKKEVRQRIAEEVADIGRFLGTEAVITK